MPQSPLLSDGRLSMHDAGRKSHALSEWLRLFPALVILPWKRPRSARFIRAPPDEA